MTGLEAFTAYYDRISQTALETQYVWGDSILKGEFIHQRGSFGSFWGGGIGIERTFSKFGGGMGDLSLYAEGYADSRDSDAPFTPFQRDVFLGARYGFNDTGDTLLELRVTYDLEYRSTLAEVRASRRLFEDFLLSLNLLTTFNEERDQALSGFTRDTQFKLRLARYF